MYSEKELARYLQLIVDDYAETFDVVKFHRRLHIKEVHLRRRGGLPKTYIQLRRLI